MSPDHEFYIPFSIPLFGVVEQDHIHINNHLNFIFHAEKGAVIGASVYPVRDTFQFVKIGTVITIHGAAKWFRGHSFNDFYTRTMFKTESGENSTLFILALFWSFFTVIPSLLCIRFIYYNYLRPKVLRSMLKRD